MGFRGPGVFARLLSVATLAAALTGCSSVPDSDIGDVTVVPKNCQDYDDDASACVGAGCNAHRSRTVYCLQDGACVVDERPLCVHKPVGGNSQIEATYWRRSDGVVAVLSEISSEPPAGWNICPGEFGPPDPEAPAACDCAEVTDRVEGTCP